MSQPELPFDNVREIVAAIRKDLAEIETQKEADREARKAARARGEAA